MFNKLHRHYSIGFVGLGQMGRHMARNLIKSGQQVTVYDANPKAMTDFKDCSAVSDLQDLKCETLITMLPNDSSVKNVYDELQCKPNLLIDCSTTSPQLARMLRDKFGNALIDAPVSGGIVGAEKATLTFMVGGSSETFNKAEPILRLMGSNAIHCGENGTGQIAKICNNLLLAITMIGASEAMALGTKLGMDAKKLNDIINKSSGRSWSTEIYNPCPNVIKGVPSSNGYKGGFGTSLMLKDVGLAVDSSPISLQMGKHAQKIYSEMCENGYASKDFSSVYEWISRENAKVKQ